MPLRLVLCFFAIASLAGSILGAVGDCENGKYSGDTNTTCIPFDENGWYKCVALTCIEEGGGATCTYTQAGKKLTATSKILYCKYYLLLGTCSKKLNSTDSDCKVCEKDANGLSYTCAEYQRYLSKDEAGVCNTPCDETVPVYSGSAKCWGGVLPNPPPTPS